MNQLETASNARYRFRSPQLLLGLAGLLFLFLAACTEKKAPAPEDKIVARVGDRNITASEFKRNYEFGMPHLKKEPDRKRSYLEYMIKEMVLAQEGYRLKLDQSERVQKLEAEMLEELLIEALFETEVKSGIKVTPDEVRDAINKSKVQWKMRFWYEPDQEHAQRVCDAMREQGYAEVVENILRSNPEIKLDPRYFESKYLTWLEVEPVVLEAIKDLPIGNISDPVKINAGYYIFQVVDIQRGMLTDYEYQERAESYRQILFYRKLNQEAINYVSAMMTPKNVVTKGPAFKILSDALIDWQNKGDRENFLESVLSAQEQDSPLYALKSSLQEPLVMFEDKQWTIREFLERFDTKELETDSTKADVDIRPVLKDKIAIALRNDFMVKRARNKNLDKSPQVLEELNRWKDKWVYEEARHYFVEDLKITDDEVQEFFESHKDRFKIRWNDEPLFEDNKIQARRLAYIERARTLLSQQVDGLAESRYPVVINQAVLDAIETVEFEKSRWASLQVFKRSNNRIAYPVADPAWGF